MAIKYKDIKEHLEKAPLTSEELKIVSRVENYIDEHIKELFDGDGIRLDVDLIDFKKNPDDMKEHSWNVWPHIKSTRKALMTEELKSRYVKAGWKWKFEEGEDDGPNRPGFDYWILTGKR